DLRHDALVEPGLRRRLLDRIARLLVRLAERSDCPLDLFLREPDLGREVGELGMAAHLAENVVEQRHGCLLSRSPVHRGVWRILGAAQGPRAQPRSAAFSSASVLASKLSPPCSILRAISLPSSTPNWSNGLIPISTALAKVRCSWKAISAPSVAASRSSARIVVEGRSPG